MTPETGTPSVSLIHKARADAGGSVSRWRWIAFGAVLSMLPTVNILLLGLSTVMIRILTPKIDLSVPKRLTFYFQNPACYTAEYRWTAKRLRCIRTFYGWLIGVLMLNLF